jgi:SH3 domain protein
MKRRLLIIVLMVIIPAICEAEKMFVGDFLEIPLRTGKGYQFDVLTRLKSGQQVEVLESDREWTKIRTDDGKEGYVRSSFLTSQDSSKTIVDSNKKRETFQGNYSTLSKENYELKAENQRLELGILNGEKMLNELNKTYETLKMDYADLLSLKAKMERDVKELEALRKKSEILETDYKKLKNNQLIIGILIGAGILLLGIILGSISKRQRRRSSLL